MATYFRKDKIISFKKAETLQEAIDIFGHDEDFEPTRQCEPTGAQPGSPEKIQVMQQRVANGETITHPNDARIVATLEVQSKMGAFCKVSAVELRNTRREERDEKAIGNEAELRRAKWREYKQKYREKSKKDVRRKKRIDFVLARIKKRSEK